ncbi:ROK family transcriptional regulator [Rugosimonospora acidiphila]|uniref:ROK family transcriptional regulator n=1 Tax=Rugosimonospora acidiphila TaxID=556531 RepID=A0ABP9RI23_9ACTN
MTHLAGSSRLLRAMNESAALSHLLERGKLTRAELRDLTGLSKPTISEAVRRLTEAGLVVVVGHVSAGPGPNAEVYAANPDAAYGVALSVRDTVMTGTPALAGAVCDVSGAVRARLEAPVDFRAVDPVDAVCGFVEQLRERSGMSGDTAGYLQIGVAGAYDPHTGTVHHVDVPGWNRPGLIARIEERVGTRVGVDNDVNLAAIAERRRGAARGAEGFALLWFGEGLGLAIDLGGTLLRGARGGAGEIGYMPLYSADGVGDADLQGLVGGRAVLALAASHGLSGRTPAEVVTAATAGPRGAPFLAALADRIAVGLVAVVAVLDPPLVVLGGEVAQAGGAALRDAVIMAMRATPSLETAVEITSVPDDAVLLGALDSALLTVRDGLLASLRG